ncbi:hypothetical protein [Tateyamaria sp. syn59]|uniref:hypothetical protein n=1 Tax=Tateyamaria sp. syn59 TaxID=2576942 RepID=UPI0011BEE078|nr:hypothetical protein [Tateyamaria sp. syn59]
MTRLTLLLCSAALAGCTTPDVTSNIETAQTLTRELQKPLQASLAQRAAADRQAAEEALIARNKAVLDLSGCDPLDDIDPDAQMPDCRLISFADPTLGDVNAYSVLEFVDLLDGYFAALANLATSTTADSIQTQSAALLAALETTGQGRSDALGKLADFGARNKGTVPALSGFAANQYRTTALRRVVAKAHPVIVEGVTFASVYFDGEDSSMRKAQDRLLLAWQQADDAVRNKDPIAHRAAVKAMKSAHTEFRNEQGKSPATALKALARHHALLLDHLNGTRNSAEVLQTLSQIDEILTALRNRS